MMIEQAELSRVTSKVDADRQRLRQLDSEITRLTIERASLLAADAYGSGGKQEEIKLIELTLADYRQEYERVSSRLSAADGVLTAAEDRAGAERLVELQAEIRQAEINLLRGQEATIKSRRLFKQAQRAEHELTDRVRTLANAIRGVGGHHDGVVGFLSLNDDGRLLEIGARLEALEDGCRT